MPDDIIYFGATNLRQRTAASGSQRYTVDVSGDSIGVNLDPKALGRPLADAIAVFFHDAIQNITAVASPATLRARAAAQRAFRGIQERKQANAAKKAAKASKPKAATAARPARAASAPKYGPAKPSKPAEGDAVRQRYSGGKMGPMEPNQTNRMFNDSRRLLESMAVGAVDDGYVINVAANRLDPKAFPPGKFEAMYAKLVELVPAFGDHSLVGADLGVRRALKESMAMLAQKVSDRNAALGMQRLRGIFGVGRAVVGLGRRFG